ncbi:MAG TPA: rhamnulokinase, partial [Actinobacteria bacterium]|nr:rhamnulokinase [Actinomycetota bacterium]
MSLRVAAIDLGASSVRVAVVDLDAELPHLEVVHRILHGPVRRPDGTLRWELDRIVDAVHRGLERATAAGPLASVGIDSWGVDYALFDAEGRAVAEPYSYRDDRTARWRELLEGIGARHLYRRTGIQLLPITTIFQLAVHDPDELAAASRLLTMAEAVAHHLVDVDAIERTTAGTTGLVDLADGDWADDLIAEIGVPRRLFPPIAAAPVVAGDRGGVPVQLVAGHDTACAFAAAPQAGTDTVVVSSGTWMLVGTHVERPVVDDLAFEANLSNEPAFPSGYRLLRNLAGSWILEGCRRRWHLDLGEVLARVEDVTLDGPRFDATDDRFLNPDDMATEVAKAAALGDPDDVGEVAGCVLRSLAHTTAEVVADLAAATGRTFRRLVVVGGGARNSPLNRLLGEATGLEVSVGPTEATALGNALVQGVGLGRFADLAE